MKAELVGYNQSPRKVRLVTDLVKGKKVVRALAELTFLKKRAADPVAKLIRSAVANATQKGVKEEDLRIENITVDSAGMLKRFRARAFGRGATIRHRKSRMTVTLFEEKTANEEKTA
ncbi:MAG TPA: 50S ribosomal protein L22 [Candidatus Kaiserbacteria bacterium]|nr:50S ribosomal protein L22 [Candidatus Kaiserbacteria bacterium]